jgi:hypothetical protein
MSLKADQLGRRAQMQKTYRYSNIRKAKSQRAQFLNPPSDDWFSELLDWLADRTLLVFGVVLVCLLLLSIGCDQVFGSANASVPESSAAITQGDSASTDGSAVAQPPTSAQPGSDTNSVFSGLFEGGLEHNHDGSWRDRVGNLAFRLTLAALLGAVVAFRPRRSSPMRHRNPHVVQSQILLTVVACALMMIVGDSAARAFGIFAAASLVRFRTNISDPKEITLLLINLGIGLAAGVGRWELATVFTLFVLLLLQILEHYEDHQAFHLMELSVRTHDVEATDEAVRELFRRNNLDVDMRELDKESEKRPLGKVVYSVDISPRLNTERLAEEIYSADPINIERLEWHRKKAPSHA